MEILPGFDLLNQALLHDNMLIMSDIHIGYEEMLNRKGFLIPRLQFDDMLRRLEAIFDSIGSKKIEKVIINGDLKHEFNSISEQEWRNTLKFIDFLSKYCNEIIIVKGNHDISLGPIARKRNVKIVDYYVIGDNADESNNERYNDEKQQHEKRTITEYSLRLIKSNSRRKAAKNKTLVIHGDKVPEKKVLEGVGNIIIGHEHPAIPLREGVRVEHFKCFLKGKFKGRNLIVLPSFNTIVEGTNLLRDEILSPFLKQKLDDFGVYIFEDKAYNFGKLKNLRSEGRF